MTRPIVFRTLGTVELRGIDAPAADALLAQPKRIALLAYLILGPSRGLSFRGEIISVLWPDRSHERGRGAMRNALHFLRQHLGSEAIRSSGDRLMVDPGSIWCDARAFYDELSEGRLGDAVALYGGDLLPGLRIDGAPRFVEWLEEERAALQRRAADAAWSLAGAAEERGHWITAVDHGRWATSVRGNVERDVRRLMGLLDRAGDRVAALRAYESFARRWQREHGLRPSPETEALAESLRAGPVTAAAARSAPAGTTILPEPTSERPRKLAVLPFLRVGSGSEHEYLSSGLTHAIIASLARVSSIRVIARTSIDRFGKREAGASVQRIAEQLDVDAVLDGSVGLSGGRLALAAQLIDARTDVPLWARVYDREPTQLLSIPAELVTAMLDALSVRLSGAERERLSRPPTADAAAYELYLRGRYRWNRRSGEDVEAAIRDFEQALELDPDFALAHAGLADAYLTLLSGTGIRPAEVRARVRHAAEAALAIDPSLGEPHATLGLACNGLGGDWKRAEMELRRAVELSPGHATAHQWLGDYLTYVLRRFDEGEHELQLARELDPLSAIICNDVALALLHRGRTTDAIRTFGEALELDPTLWRAYYDLGVTSVLAGDPERGVELLERAWRLGAFGADPDRSPNHGPEKTWRKVLEDKLAELSVGSTHRGLRAFETALMAALLGRQEEALRSLRVSLDEGSWALVLQYFPVFESALGERAELAGLCEAAGAP